MMRYRKHRGFLFATSMTVLAVMLIIGTAFLGVTLQQFHSVRKTHEALHALAMADAGINYTIWYQKYNSGAIPTSDPRILDSTTDPYSLDINGSITPVFTVTLGGTGEDKFAVWLMKYSRTTADGIKVKGYQAISKGYFRAASANAYNRTVRATLQPPPDNLPTTVIDFPQLNYAVFTESDLYVNTSSNVYGNGGGGLGSNGSVYLNTSNGGSINANVCAAGSVTFDKSHVSVNGNLQYGTKILDPKGNDITTSTGASVSGTVSSSAHTQLIPEMKSDDYLAWASSQGATAFFSGTNLTTADVVAKDILYVNATKTPGYTLNISCSIPKAAVVFVNGDVTINGSLRLGSFDNNLSDGDQSKPFILIATGSVTCSGSPEIDGVIWANGAFGKGSPTINGSIICNNVSGFQGNPTLNFRNYAMTIIPDSALNYQHAWRLASWQELP